MGLQRKTRWDLNPSAAAIEREDHVVLGEKGEDHAALTEWGLCGGDTADGAGTLNQGLVLLFLRCGTPNWAEGEGRTVCICGYSKGL